MAHTTYSTYLILILGLLISACKPKETSTDEGDSLVATQLSEEFDLQGHRGCRGLLPENSIPAFRRALELGVNTLELDLVISKDSQVIVSHEPWLSGEICLGLNGQLLEPGSRELYNLYQLSLEEIQSYDCGSHPHERFPDQQNLPVFKPTLRQVVDSSEAYATQLGRDLPYYNVEIKRVPERDGIFHPNAGRFVSLVLAAITETGISDRCTVQSFDVESLQLVRQNAPEMPVVLLIENPDPPQENLEKLGFVPEVYSPYYKLVDEELVNFCSSQKMKLIPWTVNEPKDISRMIGLGVDGLITDYPDRFPSR